jgi:hypothetical protein
MAVTRSLPVLVFFAVAVGAGSIASCTSGTTPVCDDAGACFILLPSEGSVEASVEAPVEAPGD